MRGPGLRGRIALSLVLTAAVALGVAAFALLSPLEHKLRAQELRDLVAAAVQSRPALREVEGSGSKATRHLQHAVRSIATTTGARTALLDRNLHVLASTDPDAHDGYRDAVAAFGTDRPIRRIVGAPAKPEARVALRVKVNGSYDVLALRKPLTEQRAAAAQVRRAFTTAAFAALVVALLLAGVFAATVGRRVRALRDGVMQFRLGGRPEHLPSDKASDEVGDLSRAFSEMAERLTREEEVRRDFVATASHELRTPLTTLQGRLELLADELDRPEPDVADGRRQLAEARDQADRLARLAADLLDLSRLDAEAPLRHEDIDLGELVEAVGSEFSPRANADGRELVIHKDEVHVVADPAACARVVRALLDNALRYSTPHKAVEVTVGPVDGHAAVAVSDGGPGVPATDSERIFDRFARAASVDPSAGFGLGLAIARGLSGRMGGSLELTRNGPGGATFVLSLPAAETAS